MTTPTHWLSYNANASEKGCEIFTPTLLVKEAENLSQAEISRKLFEEYLAHYKSPELGEVCRLEDFKLEKVQALDVMAQRYQVDFVNAVEYSVQVKEEPTMWMWGRGKLSSDGWIIHKFLIIGVIKSNGQYVLKLLGTGPL
jgi:hypothetical protein